MGGVSNWSPYDTHVQGGLREGQFTNGQFVLLAAGPPHLSNFGGPSALGAQDVVYPIGMTQNLALSQNKIVSRIFEIGSNRSYFVPGRDVAQLTLSRVFYWGPSLLRVLWAYYKDNPSGTFPNVQSLWDQEYSGLNFPYLQGASGGDLPLQSAYQHDVKIPPGFDNLFINLMSDLFNQPIGLLLLFRDSEEQNLGAVYLEQCYVPTHTIALDNQGLIVQESVGIQFERPVPLRMNAVSLLRGLIDGDKPNPGTIQTAL